jgi:hypothetical protein
LLRPLFDAVSGVTLDDGFYRFHTQRSAQLGSIACAKLIGGFTSRYHSFAFDWLGREIAANVRSGEVIVVDPGGGEHLKSSVGIDSWHDAVASEEDDPMLYPFYQEWRAANPHAGPLRADQAVGYEVPLFLGGRDELDNLELTDRDVYFEICTQLAVKSRGLPPGTAIRLG